MAKSMIQKSIFLVLIFNLSLSLMSCGITDKVNKKYLPDADFNTLVVNGDAAMDHADWYKAIAAYEEAASIKPNDFELRLKQANAYVFDGKLGQAFNIYQIILDNPRAPAEVLKTAKAKQSKLGFKVEPLVTQIQSEKKEEKFEDKPKPADLVIAPAKDVKDVPTVAAPEVVANKEVNLQQLETEVQAFLNSWRDAWTSKNLKDYFDHYVVTFAGDSKTAAAWRAKRKTKVNSSKSIVMNFSDVRLTSIANDQAEVSFTQYYQAGAYQDKGRKLLKLQKTSGRWRIVQESFKLQ